jgi:hypothetical protein
MLWVFELDQPVSVKLLCQNARLFPLRIRAKWCHGVKEFVDPSGTGEAQWLTLGEYPREARVRKGFRDNSNGSAATANIICFFAERRCHEYFKPGNATREHV